MKRHFFFAMVLVLLSLTASAQASDCFSKKEQEIFDLINEIRAKEGLAPFTYSQQLTHGAAEQARRAAGNPDAEYLQLSAFSPGYTAIAYPTSCRMSSKYFTAVSVLDALFEFPEMKKHFVDQGSLKFVSMGLAVEDKLFYVYLGEKHDDQISTPLACATSEEENPWYTWLRFPDLPYVKLFESEGVVSVRMTYDQWGFIDSTGKMQIPADYEGNTWFTRGLACVIKNGTAALINHQNEIVFPFGKYKMIVIDPDLPRMVVHDEKYQYLTDMEGNILSKPCDEIDIAGNGIYSYYINGKKGMMDRDGKSFMAPGYSEIGELSEGFYAFEQNGKWGFMDKNYQVKIPPKYGGPVAYVFINGLSHYSVNNKVGFMDTTGKIVLPAIYDEAGMFNSQGHCMISYKGKFGVIDRTGKYVIPAQYEYMQRDQHDGYWLAKKGELFGILGNDNQWKLKPEFEDIWLLKNNRYLVQVDGAWGMIALKF